jgi:hypothetical protein
VTQDQILWWLLALVILPIHLPIYLLYLVRYNGREAKNRMDHLISSFVFGGEWFICNRKRFSPYRNKKEKYCDRSL